MSAEDTPIPAWVDGRLAPVDKLEAHLQGLRHPAISVFVLRGNKVLIQRRALGKYHTPGLWANTVCTHPHWGESHLACAHRRLQEELGITGLELTHVGEVEYRADVGKGLIEHELVQVFTAPAPPAMTVAPNPAEVMDTAWVTLDDLAARTQAEPSRFTPWLRIYLAEHRARIFGPELAG
ncbi:isopentenyl-diphosphate Delta-isomerase [Rhodobacteraceae bacterium 2376]|uniref:Isopentenyl-diphosphate Delta-isomerase n=1 Tax=Rhabdonatronobacter sediminivivens TaxID=2743469 RepID=A0A7Z0KW01_9RHOB|nr:isopentenyl-diphosphate Delta-isomerase [Rhabdonatronobacter sediminivivens]NYS23434.1 isopentenyl-diphosphate Delta-isomerase [Rhabdonatronobacter sediminivivens]